MKKTSALKVSPSLHIPKGKVILHPNEGFDLGLMRVTHPVNWCSGVDVQAFLKGEDGTPRELVVDLLNECPRETLQMSQSQWQGLGSPPKAVVLIDGQRLFIQPLAT